MKHPLTSHISLRSLATVMATLLGQAFADGLDRAPILPKTHAAPAPSSSLAELDDLLPEHAALLAALLAASPVDARDAARMEPTLPLSVALQARALHDVHRDGHGPPLAPAAPSLPRPP